MERFDIENMLPFTQDQENIINTILEKLKKEDDEYEKRLKIYAKRRELRKNGVKVDPIDNYKTIGKK
jgi:hypothetical protein